MLLRSPTDLALLLLLLRVLLVSDAAASPSVASGPHLADVNILLPPKMTHPVEYRLQGTDGCFKWSWDHHDILAVLPEYNSSNRCSTSARLKSIAPYTGRKETAVYATDLNTGMVIRCKVYIDIFSRIQIFHSSIKLDLDGLATLRVRAFDSEENVFSSLVGLQFMWQLIPKTEGLPNHLVHVPLKDSPQSDCGGLCGDLDIQVKLEDSGVFSDLYVVKGIEIGHEIVSVHLIEPSFEHVEDKIILTVAEAMALYPLSPVYVLIGAVFNYSLKVIRGNIPQVVSLPSQFHQWSVLNTSVAQIDRTMGKAHALNLGATTIIVEDTRVAGHTQMSSLHVVLPDTLLLYILPLSPSGSPIEGMKSIPSMARWYVVSGRQYLVYVKVFSQRPGSEEIYITENDDINLHDDQSEFWNILPVSDSAAVKRNTRILKAVSYGLGKLMAVLMYSSGIVDRKEVIKVVQEVMVCDQVKFSMSHGSGDRHRILLPWSPGINQELELKVTGGCAMASNDYKWFSSDMAIVSVSASGIVQSKNPGKATVRAVSIYDSLNYDEILIEVSIPSSMVMLQNFPVEVLVGSHLQASVTLTAPDGSYFARCDAFSSSIKWKTENVSFTIINATGNSLVFGKHENLELETFSTGPPCAWADMYASSSGRTTLHATMTKEYQQLDHSVGGFIALKASLHIAAYNSLLVHQASDGNQFGGFWFNLAEAEAHNHLQNLDSLFLVPGTYFDLMLNGGPERWDQGVEFIETVEALDYKHSYLKDGALVHQVYANYGSIYRVRCEKLGTFKLVFRRGNLIGDNHPLPAVSEVLLQIMCYFPSSIVLIADETVNSPEVIQYASKAERTQGRIRAAPITVANGRTVRLSAVSISDTGKAFGNSSSLQLNWELINCDGLAFWDDAYNLAKTKSIWERFLILQNSSGLCTVRVTVFGFIDSLSHLNAITPFDSSEGALTDAARLQIVSSLRLNPEFSLLFFSHDARLNLSIAGGSCFLETVVNDSRILEVIQLPLDLQCMQLMLAPKRLGTASVTVYDIGLAPTLAASSIVQVADIDWIKITSGEEISLMEGNLLSISFLAGTDEGHTFDTSQYVYMDIQVHFEDHIFVLVDDYELESPDGYVKAPNFTIRGTHLGVTTLYLSARQNSGHEVLSQSIRVEVYAPPRLHPSEIFLVPGASYVLKVRGGPTFGAFVKYASMDDETARFQKSLGRISAISPGNTTVVAMFYGKGDVLICKAYGAVKVGIPSSAILSVQSKQLAVGRTVPIFPVLSEGNLFSFYELCSNYKWNIQDKEILDFHVADAIQGVKGDIPFHTANEYKPTEYMDKDDFSFLRVLEGITPGRTDVAVTFSCNFVSSGLFSKPRLYSANISVLVVPDLPLALGSLITWTLPPHYTSSDLLPLSSDPYSKGDASSRKSVITYSLLGECGGKMGEVKDEGMIIDGGKIKTKEADNLACIQGSDKSTGRTEVASCIRVAQVAQVRIMTQQVVFLTLAVGAELELPIKYYDVLGNPFLEAYGVALFEAETNYPDVVTIENSSDGQAKLHLNAKRPGKALVQVAFTNNQQKSDHVMIFVGAHMYPLNPVLHVGNHLNFSVNGLNGQALGYWFSANDSIMCVDKLSGKAKAINEGSTQVHYEGSDVKLHTVVTVIKGELLTVDAPSLMLTNAFPFPVKGYYFPVKLSDAHIRESEIVGNGKTSFDCMVDPQFVGFTRPWSDPVTGKLYCIFFPHFPEQLVRTAPSSADMRRGLSISVNASLLEDNSISGTASVFFVGGFSVLEMDGNSLQFNLSRSSNRSFITIVGNTDVVIDWNDQDRLSVSLISGEDSKKVGHAMYEVKICKDETFNDKLMITLQATGQKKEVDVSYAADRIDGAMRNFDIFTIVAMLVFLFLLIFGTMLYCIHKQGGLESQGFGRPGGGTHVTAGAPATPIRSSPLLQDEQSPRTPQPFIDYVRRTIDETPYYRQDFRRRVNLQNTL